MRSAQPPFSANPKIERSTNQRALIGRHGSPSATSISGANVRSGFAVCTAAAAPALESSSPQPLAPSVSAQPASTVASQATPLRLPSMAQS